MILSDKDIIKLIKENKLIISPTPDFDEIKCTHINLRLANIIKKYRNEVLDLKDNSTFEFEEITISEKGYELKPNEFILTSTLERVTIPNGYFGFIETKGNIARAGIQIHNTDGHIDPGFSGNITLEIKNNSSQTIIIYPNIKIAQIYFFQVSSESLHPYNGKYQDQKGSTVYKKD